MQQHNSILGQWRIVSMEQWDQEFVDAEMPGFIQFGVDGFGEFHFGYVHGRMDCEYSIEDKKPRIEWSWHGNDEMDEVFGRGWAVVQTDGRLNGKLYFHNGDVSGFVAVKEDVQPWASKPEAVNPVTGERVMIEIDKIRPGPIRHPDMPKETLRRIADVHARVKDVLDISLEQFELGFMRDRDAEGEIALWERIVATYEQAADMLPDIERSLILKTLIAYSMDSVMQEDLDDPDVRRIMKMIEKDK